MEQHWSKHPLVHLTILMCFECNSFKCIIFKALMAVVVVVVVVVVVDLTQEVCILFYQVCRLGAHMHLHPLGNS